MHDNRRPGRGPIHERAGRGRRRTTRRAGTVAAVLAPLALLVTSCGWFSYGFSAGNTRVNPFETTISPANASTLVETWRIDGIKGALRI